MVPPNHPFVHRVFHDFVTIHFGGKIHLFLVFSTHIPDFLEVRFSVFISLVSADRWYLLRQLPVFEGKFAFGMWQIINQQLARCHFASLLFFFIGICGICDFWMDLKPATIFSYFC